MSISDKRWKIASKYPTLLRYLFSYALIFLLPLIIMSLFVFNYFFAQMENEVNKNSYSTLRQIRTLIDTKISELNRISYQILTNKDLLYYNNDLDNPLTRIEVVNLLKYSITANQFIYEVIYYTGESNLLYSSSSTYTMDSFFNMIYKYENWNQNEFLNTIRNSDRNIFRPAEEITHNYSKDKFVTFIFPSIIRSGEKKAVIFLTREREILGSLENFPGNTVILDNNSNIIMSRYNKDYLKTQDFMSLVDISTESGFTTVELDKEKYFVSTLKSPETQWTYIQLIPLKDIYQNITYIKLVFIYGLILIILIGGIIITFFTRFNYNPIKQLKIFAEEKLGQSFSINELDAIKLSIHSIVEDSTKLQEDIRSNQPAVKEFVLSNFLKGNFNNINEFNKKANAAGFAFTLSCYQVVILHFNDPVGFKDCCSNIIDFIESHLPNGLEGYCKNDAATSRITLILSSEEEDYSNISISLVQIHKQLTSLWKLTCTLGVGNRYKDIAQIWKSYIEASTALDYRLIKGNNRIIYFEEIAPYNLDINIYPKQKIESIALCIKNGNTDRLREIVNDVLFIIKDNNTSLFMTRCICFDIINSLMKVMYDINKAYVNKQSRNFDLKSLIEFDTVEDLAETIEDFCTDICEYLQADLAQKNADTIDNVCIYINENYYNPDFSMQKAADHFNMSLANLSQYFKSHTGKTLSEYLNYIQMEKTKELLLTTDEPIQCIIEKIGFYNTSNFIRKFKHEVGVTPGEFRKSHGRL